MRILILALLLAGCQTAYPQRPCPPCQPCQQRLNDCISFGTHDTNQTVTQTKQRFKGFILIQNVCPVQQREIKVDFLLTSQGQVLYVERIADVYSLNPMQFHRIDYDVYAPNIQVEVDIEYRYTSMNV